MAPAKILRIYLEDTSFDWAERGDFNMINRIRAAFEDRGFRVEFRRNSDAERLKSAARRGYSLFHMDDPYHARALTLRRAYFYPFWRIENSAQRWNWTVARSAFRPEDIDPVEAEKFCRFWRKRLYDLTEVPTKREGFVYVPLQGRLLEHRGFQSTSPIDMIRAVLDHNPDRQVRVGFHPGETYLPEEIEAVEDLAMGTDRLAITDAPMPDLLKSCDYVVTQNSSVALAGYFFHKPAALFARIDFHHIAATVAKLGPMDAVRTAPTLRPEFDRYMYWFLKLTAINGGSDLAEDQILNSVRAHGWTV